MLRERVITHCIQLKKKKKWENRPTTCEVRSTVTGDNVKEKVHILLPSFKQKFKAETHNKIN